MEVPIHEMPIIKVADFFRNFANLLDRTDRPDPTQDSVNLLTDAISKIKELVQGSMNCNLMWLSQPQLLSPELDRFGTFGVEKK